MRHETTSLPLTASLLLVAVCSAFGRTLPAYEIPPENATNAGITVAISTVPYGQDFGGLLRVSVAAPATEHSYPVSMNVQCRTATNVSFSVEARTSVSNERIFGEFYVSKDVLKSTWCFIVYKDGNHVVWSSYLRLGRFPIGEGEQQNQQLKATGKPAP